MSQPKRKGRRRPLVPSNQAASRLVAIRPLEREGPRCSSGQMTTKLRWLLHQTLNRLRAARAWRNKRRKVKTSPSSGLGESLRSKQWKPRAAGDGNPRAAGDGSPRATGDGSSQAASGGSPRATGGAEADGGGDGTSTIEHRSRPHGHAWMLG